MMRFKNSLAVITGGCSGIGREIAFGLWREGATVCLVDRETRQLETDISLLGNGKERLRCYSLDITRDDELRYFVKNLQSECQHVDSLVHSAGVFTFGEWESISMEELDLLYKTNFRAPILLTQSLLPELRNSRGQIVFINSSAVRTSRAKVGAYSATKHALNAFAESLREEVNPTGIRVISVFPGRTATPMQALVCKLEGSEYFPEHFLKPEDVAGAVVHAMGMPRNAEVTDLHIRPINKNL
jgi:NADP-dependent 3-hydroxy acid dehydrogenase YdfG